MMVDIHALVILVIVVLLTAYVLFIKPAYDLSIKRSSVPDKGERYQGHLYQLRRNVYDLQNIQYAAERVSILMAKAEVQGRTTAQGDQYG